MSQETRKKIYLIYGAALTVLILTVAVMLTAACLRIYESGPSPFTRESIARELRSLRLPALLLLDMLVAGILLAVVLPLEEKRPRAIRENYTILARLQKRTGSITNRTEQKKRTAVKKGCLPVTVKGFILLRLRVSARRFRLTTAPPFSCKEVWDAAFSSFA